MWHVYRKSFFAEKVFVLRANFFVEANEERRHAINSTSITLRNEFSKRTHYFANDQNVLIRKLFVSSGRFVAAAGRSIRISRTNNNNFFVAQTSPAKDLLHRIDDASLENLLGNHFRLLRRHQKNCECRKVPRIRLPPSKRKLVMFGMRAQDKVGRDFAFVRQHLFVDT